MGRACFLACAPILRPLGWLDCPLHNDPRGCAKVVAAPKFWQGCAPFNPRLIAPLGQGSASRAARKHALFRNNIFKRGLSLRAPTTCKSWRRKGNTGRAESLPHYPGGACKIGTRLSPNRFAEVTRAPWGFWATYRFCKRNRTVQTPKQCGKNAARRVSLPHHYCPIKVNGKSKRCLTPLKSRKRSNRAAKGGNEWHNTVTISKDAPS